MITEQIKKNEISKQSHRAGAISNDKLLRIERYIKHHFRSENVGPTMETGCGKSTVLFSNLSSQHIAFCIDDRIYENSSVNYLEVFDVYKRKNVCFEFGPTQITLPVYQHKHGYDVVLLDGPHGYPFPDLEFYHVYPWLNENALLLIDDVHIPTIGRMFDIIREDAMFRFHGFIDYTGVLSRTSTKFFDPAGDGWWLQNFNKRRTTLKEFFLEDGGMAVDTYSLIRDEKLFNSMQLAR